jgi:arylsulfatase A-like enzyme
VISGDTVGWDAHTDLVKNHTNYCGRTDRPVAGLLQDLKRRGMLDDTLVIWGGEFGRMPMSEQGKGRDHNPWGYSLWMAGAGVKRGFAYGATDAVGLRATENRVHVRDFHATVLHLLGLDHEELSYYNHGLDERLTGPGEEARVVHELLG